MTTPEPPPASGLFPDFWQAPHRPLFLCSAFWAVVAPLWWLIGQGFGLFPPQLGTSAVWHAHEMLFGFAGAAVGAYLLTSAPSWTARPALRGAGLMAIVALWGLGRVAIANVGYLPSIVLIPADMAYFLALAFWLARDLILSGRLQKLWLAGMVAALGLADGIFLVHALSDTPGFEPASDVVLIYAILISVIGGKAVPAFSRNWLRHNAWPAALPRETRWGQVPVVLCLVAALGLSVSDFRQAGGLVLICAALLQLWQMAGWHALRAGRNPLLAMLHLGFVWLPIGMGLLGLSRLWPDLYPETDALHALTMGAMGGMIMAIASRAVASRDAGRLRAGPDLWAAFAMIWLACVVRLVAPVVADIAPLALSASLGLWCLGWLIFALALIRSLRHPHRIPVFSGAKAGSSGDDTVF